MSQEIKKIPESKLRQLKEQTEKNYNWSWKFYVSY